MASWTFAMTFAKPKTTHARRSPRISLIHWSEPWSSVVTSHESRCMLVSCTLRPPRTKEVVCDARCGVVI